MNFLASIIALFYNPCHARPPGDPQQWAKIAKLSDEFNGKSINTDKWTTHHPWYIGKPPSLFMEDRTSISNGTLNMRVTRLRQSEIRGSRTIASPVLASLNPIVGPGYYEARIATADGPLDSGIFLQAIGDNDILARDQQRIAEIDIAENFGNSLTNPQLCAQSRSHTHYSTDHNKTISSTDLISYLGDPKCAHWDNKSFHLYGARVRQCGYIDFFVDDKFVGRRYLGPAFLKPNPMRLYMILDVEPSAEQGLPAFSDPSPSSRQYEMKVDYVRSWKVKKNYSKHDDCEVNQSVSAISTKILNPYN